MSSLTLSVPEEIKKEMERFPEINWSAVAREAIKQKIATLEKMNKLLAKSELTEKETLAFGKKVTEKAAKKY
jgi:hypothetical protein